MLRRLRIGTRAFADRDAHDFDLISTRKLRALILSFAGVLTIAGGAADGAVVEDGTLRGIWQQLQAIANGANIVDVDGRDLYWLNAVLSGSPGVLVEPGATVGAHNVRANIRIPFDQPASGARFAGRLNADLMDSLLLRYQGGAADPNIIVGGDRAETMVGAFEVDAEYDDQEHKGGHRKLNTATHTNAGATADARLILPSGDIVAGVLLLATDNGVRNDDIVNRVKLQIGEDNIIRDMEWRQIQEENVDDFGLELAAGLPPFAGVAYVNLDKDKDMNPKKLMDLRNLKTNAGRITLDINAPTAASEIRAVIVGVNAKNTPTG